MELIFAGLFRDNPLGELSIIVRCSTHDHRIPLPVGCERSRQSIEALVRQGIQECHAQTAPLEAILPHVGDRWEIPDEEKGEA